MKKNKSDRKRPQASKNPDLARAMQELRRSSAAEPQRNKARYSRTDRRDKSYRNEY